MKSAHEVAIESMMKSFEAEFAIKYRRTKSVKAGFGRVLIAYHKSMFESNFGK
jgi:hypothetical protein